MSINLQCGDDTNFLKKIIHLLVRVSTSNQLNNTDTYLIRRHDDGTVTMATSQMRRQNERERKKINQITFVYILRVFALIQSTSRFPDTFSNELPLSHIHTNLPICIRSISSLCFISQIIL